MYSATQMGLPYPENEAAAREVDSGQGPALPVGFVWHDAYVPVLIVIAIVAVLAAVVFVASGRWGEMPATERSDFAPLEMGPVSATDVVLLRPPTALWGYNQQATDDALERIAESIRERDVRIVALEQLVTDLSRHPAPPMPLGSPYLGARHARPDAAGESVPLGAPVADVPGAPESPGQQAGYRSPWTLEGDGPPEVSHD
jgi:hypothetical protein